MKGVSVDSKMILRADENGFYKKSKFGVYTSWLRIFDPYFGFLMNSLSINRLFGEMIKKDSFWHFYC